MSAAGAAILAAFVLQSDSVAQEALKGFKMPWAGFAAGSSVTYRETMLRPVITDAGDLEYKATELETVWSLDGGLGEPMKLQIMGTGRQSTFTLSGSPPGWTRGKGEKKDDETVKVGDREFVCSVTTITFDGGGDAGQVTTIHRSPESPYWAVRRRVETFVKGKRNALEEARLVEIDKKVSVGKKVVVCQVVKTTIEAADGVRTVHTDLLSDAVPGRLVRRETRHYRGTREVTGAYTKKEVVTFTAKK